MIYAFAAGENKAIIGMKNSYFFKITFNCLIQLLFIYYIQNP